MPLHGTDSCPMAHHSEKHPTANAIAMVATPMSTHVPVPVDLVARIRVETPCSLQTPI